MAYDYLRQPVIVSELCFQRDADSFFNPVALGHTGFAADGFHYASGVVSTTQASWAFEGASASRGNLATFPTQALIIVSRAVIAVVDATTPALNMWMLFYLADSYGYSNNALDLPVGYLPGAVTWNNGKLTVTMLPDVGSDTTAPNILTFDFATDSIYADTHVAP